MSVEALLGTDVAFSEALPGRPGRIPARSRSPRSCAGCSGTAPSSSRTTRCRTRSRTRTRCAACRRSTARCATRWATSGACSPIEMNAATDNPLIFPDGGVADADAAGDRPRARHLRRQLPRRAGRAGARLREARPRRARLDQRAPDRAAPRRQPQRRPAGVPRLRLRARDRLHAPPVHGRRPRVGEQGRSPTRPRPTPSRRARTRRTTSRWARSPGRQARPVLRPRRADRRDRAAVRGAGARPSAGDARRAPRPGAGVAAAHAAVREVVRPWDGDREPGPDLEAVDAARARGPPRRPRRRRPDGLRRRPAR